MPENVKRVDELRVEDFQRHPVWRFTNSDEEEHDETVVEPVKPLPVEGLDGEIVGTQVLLANGQRIWAFATGVTSENPRRTQHFRSISLERDGRWFHLARDFDFDFEQRSPDRAAEFLGLSVDDVFPITSGDRRRCVALRTYYEGTSRETVYGRAFRTDVPVANR